jgi:hypothetical protein
MTDTRFAGLLSQIIDKLDIKQVLFFKTESEIYKSIRPNHQVAIQLSSDGAAVPSQMVYSDNLHKMGFLGFEETLERLKTLTLQVGFFYARIPEKEVTESTDIDQPADWWIQKLIKHFDIQTFQRLPDGFYAVVYPKPVEIIHGI